MKLRKATREDARLIGESVVSAIGEEITDSLAGEKFDREDVIDLFTTLAMREDTQYSYLNTLVAEEDNGEAAGVAVAYDGANLDRMRRIFFKAVKERLERDMSAMGDECEAGEFYLDTLAVRPAYRGRGYARALIEGTARRAAECGKPLGLLVEKENHPARRLYDSCGFKQVGETPFAFVLMDHLQMSEG